MTHTRTFGIAAYNDSWSDLNDQVVIEEPLEIRLGFQRGDRPRQQSVSITMRTPGDDFDLALGFLYSERILTDFAAIQDVVHCGDGSNTNVVRVELNDDVDIDLGRLQRHFYTTSSCGVCGKTSLEALSVTGYSEVPDGLRIAASTLAQLPTTLRAAQKVFSVTGGLHGAGLFAPDGELIRCFEDVGRHNAVDKLMGSCWRQGALPLSDRILSLSGRASFELLQKALSVQIPIVVAVGAPSSMAIELARKFNITLAGFVRDGRFNIYSHPERIAR